MAMQDQIVDYEILLRFGTGEAHQNGLPLGAFCGAHLKRARVVVDDKTGERLAFKELPPEPVPQDKLADLVGGKVAKLTAGFDAALAERAAALEERDKTAAQLADMIEKTKVVVAELNAEIAQRDRRIAAQAAALERAEAASTAMFAALRQAAE